MDNEARYFLENVELAYDILADYVEDGETFNPLEYDEYGIDWDVFVYLIPLAPTERHYFTPDELVRALEGAQIQEDMFPSLMTFGATADGRVYSELPAPTGYKIMGWTERMQKWIDENAD